MFSFFRRTSKGRVVLVADVEGSSAAVAVVSLVKHGPARVLVSERSALSLEQHPSEQSVSTATAALADVAKNVLDKYTKSESGKDYGPVSALHVTVGAPWVRSRTAKTTDTFPEERVITDAMIKELAKKALTENSELTHENIFESNVTRVQLNGYPTAQPAGKRAKNIVVTVFESDIDPAIRSGVEHALLGLLPGRKVDFRSQTRALLTVLHEQTDRHSYLILVVGTDATSCVAVRKEELTDQIIIPEGVSSIVRRVAGEKGLPEETLSLLRMLGSDTTSLPASDTLKATMAIVEPALVKLFGEAFVKLAEIRRIPNSCFLSVHNDVAPWLEHFFTRIDFAQFTTTMQPFEMESLTPEHVRAHVQWEAGAREDTGLGISVAFVSISQQSS